MAELPLRLASKIEVAADGCWLWTAAVSTIGYGRYYTPGKQVQAHRHVYELLVGPVPDGMEMDHLCRVRRCVNPEHLEPVTHRANVLRGTSPFAAKAKQTHCLRGHKFTDQTTYVRANGTRWCLECKSLRRKAA